ncbi:MAG: hypothetical protein ACOY0T_23930 [Myxococcota bacterium]
MSRELGFGVAGTSVGARALRGVLAFVLLAFCAAPVPGDVGGCNQSPEELDPVAFFASKARLDCQRCEECGFDTQACTRACANVYQSEFPKDCIPLVHDGEVCLRALAVATCGDYRDHVRDVAPTVPTECNFCPESAE